MSGRSRAAAALVLALVAGPGRAEVVNRIVATIDGEPITAHELQRYAEERASSGLSQAQMLDSLVTDRLLEREVQAQGIVVRPEDIDAYMNAIRARNRMDDAAFAKALAAQGMTLETYRSRVKAELEKTQLVNREIRARVTVSPEEVERYYKQHEDDYTLGDSVTVRDIFFAVEPGADPAEVQLVRAKAEEVRAMAADGKRFEDLAAQYSQGPGADKGGLLGTFRRGAMAKPLEDAAFKLKPKEVSPVIPGPRGFHILQVVEVMGAGKRPLDEVKDDIRERLYGQQLESRFSDWLSRELRERHHVEVLN